MSARPPSTNPTPRSSVPSIDSALQSALVDLATDDPRIRGAVVDLINLAIRTYVKAMTQGTVKEQLAAAAMFVKPVMQSLTTNEGDTETRVLHDEMRAMMAEMRHEITGQNQADGADGVVVSMPVRDSI